MRIQDFITNLRRFNTGKGHWEVVILASSLNRARKLTKGFESYTTEGVALFIAEELKCSTTKTSRGDFKFVK